MALRRKEWVRWIVSWFPHRLTVAIHSLLRWERLALAKVGAAGAGPCNCGRRYHAGDLATMIAVLGFFLPERSLTASAQRGARGTGAGTDGPEHR